MRNVLFGIITVVLFLSACSQPEKEMKKFTFDNDGMLVVHGERTFIIGSYYAPKSDNPWLELQQDGYNYVRTGADKEKMDAAYAHDLYTWVSIGSINPEKPESQERLKQNIQKFKDHPSLLCWEMQDEPAFTWNSAEARVKPEPLIETFNVIKSEDPEHLIYTNHAPVNLVSTMQKYNPSTDIIACDVYPVIPHGIRVSYALYPDGLQGDLLNPYISQVGEYTDKMRKVGGPSKPLFMVLQGFSWEMLRKENDRDPKMVQYPSYEESRFMAYNAIIHGANGIVYWGTSYTPADAPFWPGFKKVTRELGDMQPVLAARKLDLKINKQYHELGHSVDAGVEILAKQVDGKTWLMTANADRYPVKVTFSGLSQFKIATVLQENRTVTIENNELTDNYKPFDVHIYELTNPDSK